MPVVKIDMWEGRPRKKKEKLIQNVTKAVSDSLGCPKEDVTVILSDVSKDNWGCGGVQASRLKK
jgi:4-oxalocrotonate tautomerase